jgi:hypothetical protein
MAWRETEKLALLMRMALMRVATMWDKLAPAKKRWSGRKQDGWN